MKWIVMVLVLGIFLLSCSVEPQHKNKINESMSFEGWRDLPKLNVDPLESDAHHAFLDLYADEKGKTAYEGRSQNFPVGSKIIKPLYNDLQRSKLARLTIMVKMPPGYDNENGDWWYGVYDPSGKEGWYQGRIRSCIVCHKLAKETDYMFSQNVMEEIEVQKGLRIAETYPGLEDL